jgi:hypothetical protein
MNQKAFFESLGAPLVNARWSWGAVRGADGVILLRVWQDNVRTYDSKQFVRILRGISNRSGPHELGRRERVEHINQIRNGSQCYMIMCEAEDTTARPRRVRRFNANEVFPGGALRQIDDDLWAELLPSLLVAEFASRRQTAKKR